LPIDQEHINVEMDPTSECEVRQEIADRQLQIVGWYHSHPTFLPDPSLVDIENQRNYQHLFRDDQCNEEPFVGAIVGKLLCSTEYECVIYHYLGPYDARLPGSVSVINWFYVSRAVDERDQPKRLRYTLSDAVALPQDRAEALVSGMSDEMNTSDR
jgi:hypothetical protein